MADPRIPQELLAHLERDVVAAMSGVREEAIQRLHNRLVDAYTEQLGRAAASGKAATDGRHAVSDIERTPQSRRPQASRRGCYLYAVVAGNGTGAGEGAEGVQPGSNVRLVQVDDLTALVSEIHVEEFAQLDVTDDSVQLDEASPLARAVRAHDAVIDTAFRAGPVVPVRFGTVLPDLASITDLVRRNSQGLRDELARLGSHVEWGLKLYAENADADDDGSADEVSETGSEYLRKKQRGREHAVSERARLNEMAAHVDRSLQVLSTAEVIQPPRSTAAGAPLFCASYLVPLPEEQRFLGTLDDLQRSMSSQGIRIERTGPWPPYDFVTVHLDEPVATPGEPS